MAARPTKKRVRNSADLDLMQMYGDVPSFKGNVTDSDYNGEFGHALNWCSRGLDPKDAKKELLFWMKGSYTPTQIESLQFIDEHHLGTLGAIAFLDNNAFPIKETTMSSTHIKVKEFVEKGKVLRKARKAEAKIKSKIKKEVKVDHSDIHKSYEIYEITEDSLFDNYALETDSIRIIAEGSKPAVIFKAMTLIEELKSEMLLTRTDKDVAEAYQHITKRNITKIVKGFDLAISLLEVVRNQKLATGNSRKASKPKSAAQQVDKMKFKKKDAQLKVTSIDPKTIVGAARLVVFNTKTRKLGHYIAKDTSGLMVRNNTIVNIDEKASIQKTIRATADASVKDTVVSFKRAAKNKSIKMFEDVDTLGTRMTGKMTEDIIVLKAF